MISIIIPAYNCAKTIVKTLDSIVEQDYLDYEVIIVDDGSTDNTNEVINNYKKKCNKRIIHVSQTNGGPGAARNKGLEIASGDFIAFIDSDDIVANDFLSTLIGVMKDNVDLTFAQYYRIIDDNIDSKCLVSSEISGICNPEETFASFICNKSHISLWNALFKRNLIEANGLRFINCYSGEDVEFISRYLMECRQVCFIEKPIYFFNFDSKRSERRMSKNSISCIEQSVYWPLLAVLQEKNWVLGFGALAYGKLPVDSMLSVINKVRQYVSYREFKSCFYSECNNLIKVASQIDKRYIPQKTYFKCELLNMCINYFPFVFFVLVKQL